MVSTVLRRMGFAVAPTFLVAAIGCGTGAKDEFERVRGNAMGTTFTVQAACPVAVPTHRLVAVLERVDREMSTYDGASELSAFNRAPVGVAVAVSPWLVEVADAAQRVAGPLVAF